MNAPLQVVAVDWSGDARAPERKIWAAEVIEGELVNVRRGGRAPEMAADLVRLAEAGPLIVGLDFAFSFPRWFVTDVLRAGGIREVWEAAERDGETWLAECKPPFWGRPNTKRPERDDAQPYFRRTEKQMPFPAKSVFQIGGGGAVGTGSVRGMPLLRRLHDAGFNVWPFEDAAFPLVIEIYPRVLTRAVIKSDAAARRAYLDRDGRVPPRLLETAASDEDPFDAAISALEMAAHAEEIRTLRAQPDFALEGAIWQPGWSPDRRYLDPGLPDGYFVLDYPDGTGEGPFHSDETSAAPDGTVAITPQVGTPRVLRIVDIDSPWLVSRDGVGKRWRLRARPVNPPDFGEP